MFRIRSTFIAATATILVCIFLGGESIAQSSGKSDSGSAINLKFTGGTAQEYINAIQKQAGDVNILLDIEGKNVPMPAVELMSVNVTSAIMLLEDREANVDSRYVSLDVNTVQPVDQWGQPIYYIRAKTAHTREPIGNTVISVKDIIESGSSADDLLTAVSTTIELLGGDTGKAEIRFHEPTALLIAKGQAEQMRAIHQVIDQIRASNQRNDQKREFEAKAHEYYQQVLAMKDQLAARTEEINSVIQQLTEARTRTEMYEREVANARQVMDERESQLMTLQVQLRALQEEIHQLRKTQKEGNS